jgi:hypothetical protein
MDNFFQKFELDIWWKFLLMLGVIFSISPIIFDIKILDARHLVGLGLGLILIGISYFIANRHISQMVYGGILSTQAAIHTWYTRVILVTGIIVSVVFFASLVMGLLNLELTICKASQN